MKVALVHDYIKEYGGAERVLEALHEIWPEAPVFTTVYLPEYLGPHKDRFKRWDIRTSRLQNIPFIAKLISPVRLLTPWVFENIDFTGYDVIIVSATGAYFPNLIVRKPTTVHICYCHTPPRYLYGYPTARNWKKNPLLRFMAAVANHHLREVDFIAAQRPDYFIANSRETKRRIEKFYRREAEVIYPPVELSGNRQQTTGNRNKKYYLTGGRLARAKRIDLAIEACNKLQLPLKVFGKEFADYGKELKKIAGPTIEFVGEVDDGQLYKLYQNAKAFIYPALEEDFGIMPVEAMSAGTPVIALAQGGLKETVTSGKTGILFAEPTIDDLMEAIKKFNHLSIKADDCIEQAKKFGGERFKKEIIDFINSKVSRLSGITQARDKHHA
jgi:glycosyltransferase involved in cell wall biosynthesis